MVKNRYEVAKGKSTGKAKGKGKVGLPIPLESLEVTSRGEGCIPATPFAEIENIVGYENVRWNTDEEKPTDALAVPEELETQIAALTQTLHALEHRLHSRIGDAKKRRNQFSAIHRLPVETLVEVFRTSLSDIFGSEGYYLRLGKLSAVCSLWAAIVDQAPTLWTSICRNDKRTLIAKALSKSGDSSLSVSTYSSDPYAKGYHSLPGFLDQVGTQVHRWQIADLFVASNISVLQKSSLLDASAPRLQKLRIRLNGQSPEGGLDLFRGKTERLQELDVAGTHLKWSSQLLTGLRILRLADIRNGMDATQLFTTLRRCPELTELNITRSSITQDRASELPERVELPRLRHLDLGYLSPPGAAFEILPRVVTPKYQHFSICSPYNEAGFTRTVSHICPAFSLLLSSVAEIDITIKNNELKFTGKPEIFGDTPFAEIHILQCRPYELLDRLVTTFGQSMKEIETSIFFDDTYKDEKVKDYAAIAKIPSVTTLSALTRRDLSDLINHLATPSVLNGTKRWPHPRLRHLSLFEQSCKLKQLLQMVENRYGVAKGKAKGKGKGNGKCGKEEFPEPLETLDITGQVETCVDGTLFRKIEKVVGRDHVLWIPDDDEPEDYSDEYDSPGLDYDDYDPYYDAHHAALESWGDYF
ncbi:hypothetical protein FRB99_005842 [Tulasnella sp. 403]|nr:hypothetical protein FRB99_005842 [Tulasnella sp. 403]